MLLFDFVPLLIVKPGIKWFIEDFKTRLFMKKPLFILSLILLVLGFCLRSHAQNPTGKMAAEKNPQFMLMNLKISKVRKHFRVEKTESRLTMGVYKRNDESLSPDLENDFFYFIVNEKNEVMDSVAIKNPLITRIEYPNENGEIGSTVLEKEEDFVLIRFNYVNQMDKILIKKMRENGKWKTLATYSIGPAYLLREKK